MLPPLQIDFLILKCVGFLFSSIVILYTKKKKKEIRLYGSTEKKFRKENEKYMKTEHPYLLQQKARVFVSCYVLGNLIQLCFNLLTLFLTFVLFVKF